MIIQEDDIVMCTVKRIEKTTVFLEIDDSGEGTMIFSEVSPGRIRNIRDFVVIGKKIVCKVLRTKDNHTELSLRRVTAKERDEVLERYKKARMLESMLKPVFKDKTQGIIEKIKKTHDLSDFLDEARENTSLLDNLAKGQELEQLRNIFAEKKEKEKEVKKTVIIKSDSPDGLEKIKSLLSTNEATIIYQGSSKFYIITKAKDFKTANHKLESILLTLKEKAKSLNVHFEIKEK
ncbi:hypothetical protein COU60_04560 [Candidatus Pacearchaeota archaeon CG10_big_fil_rev_8_21_14_0_10_34_76]|nr:MAG: hypothetical protein COU60_04560 [Candidatus Pacearchaeota archaeon CG10_big_fil_rev_8_21_14_0_10_34_76]